MKLFQKGELKLLWPFYLETIVSTLFFIYPAFWIIQLQQTLSLTQVGILFATISVSVFLFEIPTGAIADLYGRKFSVPLGCFLSGLALMSLLFVKSFYGMLIVFFLWGLFVTFGSGAGEAWVTDNLKFYNKSHILKNYFIKKQSLIGLSLFFAGFIGSLFVNKFGLDIIWPITGFSLIISGIILSFIKEHKITKEKKQNFKDLFKQAKISVKYSLKHNTLFFLIIATFFIMFRDSFGGDLVWQPLLKNLGFPIFSFGFLFSGISLISSIIPLFSNFFLKKFKEEKNYLSLLLFLSIILDILVIFVNNFIIGIVILVAMFITFNLFMPINQAYFQKFVPSKMRATITSFQGMVVSLAYAISSPLSGIIADNIGPKYTIVLGSIFLIPAFILYLKIKQEEEKPETC